MTRQDVTFTGLVDNPLWYRDAVIYQLHVKSFYDSDGDGIGDFNGLSTKLDYLQDLGVTALWLMPFCQSPLRDDGYDISDYRAIHPAYGTLKDFKAFLKHAHHNGLRVITELVLNHTSDQHAWFQRARRAKPDSPWRDWYVWSDTPDRYPEARIIFQDFETSNWTWDPVAGAYYWHRFYSHQPDLNFDNPRVRKAVSEVLDFWLGLGVDGLRLDAIPYLFEREGTNCENLPETHEFLKQLRTRADAHFRNRMLLAEANQWPEDAAAYFGSGDECHMNFHFPLMPRLFMAVHMEDSLPIVDILDQTPEIPESCQWAIFLRNHDELTLEMVTDEERDYMYRVYARDPRMRINLGIRRRLFPLLGNHRRRTELASALLFSLPGSPILYYGDEIGMGDNVYLGDRDGVRTPMQWSTDRNAGFSRADPQKLFLPVIISPEYHYEALNVEVQQSNPHSVLWWMKRMIALRKRFLAFSRGTIEFLRPDNARILAFTRRYRNERLLVVANLSRFSQYAELDLSGYQGMAPIELFGKTTFPTIGSSPYVLTLGPHSFFWFYLTPAQTPVETGDGGPESGLPVLEVDEDWRQLFTDKGRGLLEDALPGFIARSRWFGPKRRPLKLARVRGAFRMGQNAPRWYLLQVEAEYLAGEPDSFAVPLACAEEPRAARLATDAPAMAVARVRRKGSTEDALLHDALADPAFGAMLVQTVLQRRQIRGTGGSIRGVLTGRPPGPRSEPTPEAELLTVEHRNTCLRLGDSLFFKFIRNVAPEENPEVEIGRVLAERRFPHCPPLIGALELHLDGAKPATIGILQAYVPHQGTGWDRMTAAASEFYRSVPLAQEPPGPIPGSPAGLLGTLPPGGLAAALAPGQAMAELIGRRTAALHACLAADTDRPGFRPVPFTKLYQRALYQSMRTMAGKAIPLLRWQLNRLPQEALVLAADVIGREPQIMGRFKSLLAMRGTGMRIRCHGDYHLGQLLFTGADFVIIDFEGDPTRPLSERRIKRSPLRDAAGMLRSFHYAAHTGSPLGGPDSGPAGRWAETWAAWAGAAFLKGYLGEAGNSFLPSAPEETRRLLDAFLLETAITELEFEMNRRPGWAVIPLGAIRRLLDDPAPSDAP
jgi:maltose alpha-D-glucosyltransferase/alpha-amylase